MTKIMISLFLALFLAPAMAADKSGAHNPANLQLASVSAVVMDASSGEVLYQKYANMVKPIASLTKVMTAMVVLDAKLPLNETIRFSQDDRKAINYYHSRIRVDSELDRGEVLRLALMSSENLAAAALGRNFPGGLPAFVAKMNAKARALGMKNTRYVDSSGLSHENVSTAADLAKLVAAAAKYKEITNYSTTPIYTANFSRPRYRLDYVNTNPLVRYQRWDVAMSKTGYLDEAGRCLVMKAKVDGKDLLIVMLDSFGKTSPMGDAGRIKRWLASGNGGTVASAAKEYQKRKIATHLASRATASIR
ncbi:MAG: D-alanyl-D-alanine endopeptidase [Zhongshania sp.]|uniref:D-alanyl-D-alanine endopeptidase n=1 Tax=Zhongshania sp. TaxID=1971902 RepID=UPI0026047ED9|nr:D-alanyl-D-alanine endopeptidase [Zhongshania sp.]MDF1692204.1 D-alanyl-D-alanine endopeptidase [Zhongshania sp.]